MSKCPNITPIIYCLQEKSRLFGLEGSAVYIISSLYMLNCFKYFLVYVLRHIALKYISLSQNKEIHFGLKIRQENYIKSSCRSFYAKMSGYSQIFLNCIKYL